MTTDIPLDTETRRRLGLLARLGAAGIDRHGVGRRQHEGGDTALFMGGLAQVGKRLDERKQRSAYRLELALHRLARLGRPDGGAGEHQQQADRKAEDLRADRFEDAGHRSDVQPCSDYCQSRRNGRRCTKRPPVISKVWEFINAASE
jgi:uncharacterized protein (DUF2126 family)